MTIFLGVFIASFIFIIINLYILKSLQNRFTYNKNKKYLNLFFIISFFAISLAQILYFISLRLNYLNSGLLYALLTSTIALSFMLFIVCSFFDIMEYPLKFIEFKKDRREFIKFGFNLAFIIVGFSYILKGFYNGFKKPFINRVEIKIKNLKNDLNLAVLSDIHLGKHLGKEFLDILINDVNSLNADALLIIGDMFDIKSHELNDTLEPLKKLNTPCFFVLGNHEYYTGDIEGLIKTLSIYNAKVLENENIEFNGIINLAGVYDRAGDRFGYKKPNLKQALKDKNETLPTILLAHQPKYIYEKVRDEADLCICGHTHAGQIFPFSLLVLMEQKYVYGLYKETNRQIYVSSGAGFWGPPVRFLAPAEIALLNLKKA